MGHLQIQITYFQYVIRMGIQPTSKIQGPTAKGFCSCRSATIGFEPGQPWFSVSKA